MIALEPASPSRRVAMRHAVVLCSTMALALVSTPARARALHLPVTVASTTAPSLASGPLRIEVDASIDGADLIPGWIQDRNPSLAEEIPSIEGHVQWIAVTISGATYDYRVSVVATRDGAPLDAAAEPVVCECNSEALLELVDARIAEELAALRAAPRPEEESGDPAEPGITEGQSSGAATGPTDRPRPGPTGYTGVAVGVLGAGLLAAGIPLALQPAEIRGEPGAIEKRSMHNTGISLAVGGSVALAVGMSMLVVDLVRQRHRGVAIVPVLDHRQMGIAITWRARGRMGR